jgi:peroxiredoxin
MMLEKIRGYLKIRWVRWGLELTLMLLVYFGVRAWMQRDLPIGPAPAIQAITLTGQPVELAALARQGPVLVHFWATWCPICALEQGSIQSISTDHPVITIASQSGDDRAVHDYMQEHALSFAVVMDEDGELMQRYGLRGVPASFIIDRNGKIVYREVGYTTEIGLRIRLWLAD